MKLKKNLGLISLSMLMSLTFNSVSYANSESWQPTNNSLQFNSTSTELNKAVKHKNMHKKKHKNKHKNKHKKKHKKHHHKKHHHKKNKITTTRDAQGVWFIKGSDKANLEDVFEAMGYAVATDRLFQMDVFRRQGRGTLAELFGAGFINTDVFLRNIAPSQTELTQMLNTLDPEAKQIVKGYVAGVNKRIQEVNADPSMMPAEYVLLNQTPQNYTEGDIISWLLLLARNFDTEGYNTGQIDNYILLQSLIAEYPADALTMFNDLVWFNDPDADTVLEAFDIANVDFLKIPTLFKENATAKTNTLNKRIEKAMLLAKHQERIDVYHQQMKAKGAFVKMGSYAWAISGDKTESGNPILYSGPQMGFTAPTIAVEGSIQAGGLNISGLTVPGIPVFNLGRTPHHAWASQVGQAHTTDYHVESLSDVYLDRVETFKVAGQADIQIPIYRGKYGPIIEPLPFDPQAPTILSWRYANKKVESKGIKAYLDLAKATSMDEFGAAIENVGISQHFTYVDRDGNIAYWMSGIDPVRPNNVDPRFPQVGDGWADINNLVPRSTNRNSMRGYYGGWNNKTNPDYNNPPNSQFFSSGPFHRAHVIYDYLEDKFANPQAKISYDEVCALAVNIASTNSLGGGGNTWQFVENAFTQAITNNGANVDQQAALDMLASWDGHYVAGGPSQWATGTLIADAWILQYTWINKVLEMTFDDENLFNREAPTLFNVLLHGLNGAPTSIVNQYDWFSNLDDPQAPQTADAIIVAALDAVIADIGLGPYNEPRGNIVHSNDVLGPIATTPFGSRSTYAQCVEMGPHGPVKIGSMFPLGPSGDVRMVNGQLVFNPNYFSMSPFFDTFTLRDFPLFDDDSSNSDSSDDSNS